MFANEEGENDQNKRLFSEKLKNRCFSIYNAILQGTTISFWQAGFFLIIEIVQQLFFVFYPPANYPWHNSDWERVFNLATKITLVWPYLAEENQSLFLFFFYASGILLVIAVASFLILLFVEMKKRSLIRTTLIRIFGYLLFAFQTVLFLPLLTVYLLMLSCDSSRSHLFIQNFSCWTLEHYLHSSAGCLFLMLLLVVVIPTVLFYDNSYSSPNAYSRMNSQVEVKLMLYKAILTGAGLMFNTSSNSIFISYISIGLAFLLVYEYRFTPRYFEPKMNKLWNALHELFLLACCCNILAIALESYEFGGSLVVLSVAGVILLLFEFFFGEEAEYVLTLPFSQIITQNLFDLYVKELSSLLNNKNINRKQGLYIRGYLGEHARLCPTPNECSLGLAMKSDKASLETIDKTQHIYKSLPMLVAHGERIFEYYIENYAQGRLAEINIMFAKYIIAFSKEPTLAIKYLTNSRNLNQSLQEEFFTYRYERLLNESFKAKSKLQDNDNINVLNVIKYEKYQQEFNDLIEENGLLHMQFWSILQDDSPSMTKFCSVGFKILEVEAQVEHAWEKIQSIFPNNPKDLNKYADYLFQVYNDKELGTRITEKAKDSAYTSKFNMLSTRLQDISNFSQDGSACVFMSGKKTNIGEIRNCNLAFCRIFGYSKKEIIGQKIRSVIPNLISEQHDKFIMLNLERIKISFCDTANREIQSFGLHQSKYMFPLFIKIQSTPNILNEMHYIAKIKPDRKNICNSVCYLLLNPKHEVTCMTSSSICMLNISNSTLNNYVVDMGLIAPSLFKPDLYQHYMQKNGSMLTVFHPSTLHRQNIDEAVFHDDVEILGKGENGSDFLCNLSELNYEAVGLIGYTVRLEFLPPRVSLAHFHKFQRFPFFQFCYWEDINCFVREMREDDNNSANMINSSTISHMFSMHSKDSGYSKNGQYSGGRTDLAELSSAKFKKISHKGNWTKSVKSLYLGMKSKGSTLGPAAITPRNEHTNKKTFEEKDVSIQRQQSFVSLFSEYSSKPVKNKHSNYFEALMPKYKHLSKYAEDDYGTSNLVKLMEKQQRYDEGIKTYRIVDGEITEILEDTYSQLLVREIEAPQLITSEGRRNIERKRLEEIRVLKSRIKTKYDLRKIIDETPYPASVNFINTFTIICTLLLSVLLIAEYIYTRYRLQDIISAIDTLTNSYSLEFTMLSLWYQSRELFLISGSNYTVFLNKYSNSSVYRNSLQTLMSENTYSVNKIVEQLADNSFSFTEEDKKFLETGTIPIYFYSQSQLYTMVYSVYQASVVISEAFLQISRLESNQYSSESEWLLNTAVDSLYSALLDGYSTLHSIFSRLLERLSIKSDTIDYILISLSAFDLIFCFIVGIILTKYIEFYESKLLHVFLEVPRPFVMHLNSACEAFISDIQNKEKRIEAEDDEEDEEKVAGSSIEDSMFLRYRGGYERRYTNKKSIGFSYLISYLVLIILAEGYFIFQFVMRMQFYGNLQEFSTIYEKSCTQRNSYLKVINFYREYYNYPGTNIGRKTYLTNAVEEKWRDLYDIQKESQSYLPTECSLLSSSNENKILNFLRGNLCDYPEYYSSGLERNCSTIGNQTATLGLNSLRMYVIEALKLMVYNYKSSSYNYLNDEELWEIKQIHDNFLVPISDDIQTLLKDSATDSYNKQLNERIIYLVVFTFGLNLIFLILCYPFLRGMNTFVYNTRAMFTIVPIEGVILCKSFDKLVLQRLKK